MKPRLRPNFQIIGHRGSAGLTPENTLISFKRAAALGLNWVEFDVRQCGSGEWIVFHDETLERTTNGQGAVAEIPYEIIKTLDAGSWFNRRFFAERVPLFSETLTLLHNLQLYPNVEIKSDDAFSGNKKSRQEKALLVDDFLTCLNTHWPVTLHTPLISSFDREILTLLKARQPALLIGYLVEAITPESIKTAVRQRFDSIHCHYQQLPIAKITEITRHLPLLVFTLNDEELIAEYLGNGVTAVFSDMTHYKYRSF
jgi:glycerophosphoryl diester phosphodiesterase